MNPDLAAFLEHARSRGMDPGTIRMLLLSAGWKEKDVARALAEHALDLPVPAPPDAGGARDAFLYLTAFAAMYAAAIAGLSLLFGLLNLALPDAALEAGGGSDRWRLTAMRWQVATLLVAFPAFLVTSRLLLREMRAQQERAWSAVRRWLTYLTLFVAAVALGADFVTLLYYFLEGDVSLRFVLKVAAVALVAGLAFTYYLRTVRMPARSLGGSRMHGAYAGVAAGLAVATLAWGLWAVGSPQGERRRKLDERRLEQLRSIEGAIDRIVRGPHDERPAEGPAPMRRPLPATLEEVRAEALPDRPAITDPATAEPYVYRVTGEATYELCATFDRARDEDDDVRWNHPAGAHCFAIDVMSPR